MSKQQDNKSPSSAILLCISKHPQGASLRNILVDLEPSFSKRTLQRYLTTLVNNGHLYVEGHTSNRRYHLTKDSSPIVDTATDKNRIIPLSSTAISLLTAVRQPIQARSHVSYNRDFLDSYRPNVTQYLPPIIREELHNLGRSPDGNHPAGTYAKQILHRLLIDLSWNSSRLEGNTYSLLETERLLNLGEAAEGKDNTDAQMILNHKDAIEFMVESATDININRYTILNLHALLSQNLLADSMACGRVRSIPVGIAKSVYHPLEVPQLINECFDQILDTAKAIKDPFEQAFFLMVHLPYLQPFEDVNKRVSRLAANLPFIRKNLCPLSFVDVPEAIYIGGLLAIYELNQIELLRDVFIWAYKRSCSLYSTTRKVLGEPDPFRLRYRNSIAEVITTVVHQCMNSKMATAAIKQRSIEMMIPFEDQPRFIEVVETELMKLHEGNIARYRLRPSEFEAWQKTWP